MIKKTLYKSSIVCTLLLGLIIVLVPNTGLSQSLYFERVFDESLAQASYVIGNQQTGQAIVIDPKRDIDTYLDIAQQHGFNITHISETHIHADFLSGSRELAAATGAELYLSAEGGPDWQYEFAHTPLKDGDKINLGQIVLEVMHTPGHTPESITFLVQDLEQLWEPIKAITGDFIFVGDVGRPDLLEKAAGQSGTQEIGAKQLYTAINRFKTLPETTEIWPGHGAGSFCGKTLSNIPNSTLKEEMLNNPALQFQNNEEGFVKYILEGQPEPPKYFSVMKRLNKVERPLKIEIPKHPVLSKKEVETAIKNGLTIIDTRPKEMVVKGSIPGSLQIEGANSFSTFMGSLIDYNKQLILIASEKDQEDLTRKLMRIGMDNIYGFIDIDDPSTAQALVQSEIIDAEEVKQYLQKNNVQFVDVRTNEEYENGHIDGFENIPLNTIEQNLDKFNKSIPIIIHCQSGVRAGTAYSILKKNGFDNILNYSGGINDWTEKNNELVKEKQ